MNHSSAFFRACWLLAFLLCPLLLTAVGTPIPAPPTHWVTDTAGFLSESTATQLDNELADFERATGHQVIVYIAAGTGGVPIEDWAVHAFEAWRIGRKSLDDGLLLLIMAEDHQVRIEVGYGLEGTVPDALANGVLQDILLPGIRAGDQNGAVTKAVSSLLSIIDGQAATVSGEESESGKKARPISIFQMLLFGLAVIGFIILFITNPTLAIYLLFSILSGGRGGGRGFSGGGGRSGGGGASGSW